MTVYKVYGIAIDDGALQSPVMKSRGYELGVKLVAKSRPPGPYGKLSIYLDHFSHDLGTNINDLVEDAQDFHGAFHSFKNLDDAKSWSHRFSIFMHFNKYVICKCTIPADTKYIYEGVVVPYDGYEFTGYASESIILDEIVYEEEYQA